MLKIYTFTCPTCGGHDLIQVETTVVERCVGQHIGLDALRGSSDLYRVLLPDDMGASMPVLRGTTYAYRCAKCEDMVPMPAMELRKQGMLVEEPNKDA